MEQKHFIVLEYIVTPEGNYDTVQGVYHSMEECELRVKELKPKLKAIADKYGLPVIFDQADGFCAGTKEWVDLLCPMISDCYHVCVIAG